MFPGEPGFPTSPHVSSQSSAGSLNVLLISCLLQPLGPQPVSRGEAAWWRKINESEQNTRWTLAQSTTIRPPNSPEQLVLCLWWTLSLWARRSSAAEEQEEEVFKGYQGQAVASFPFTPLALTRHVFTKSWSAWGCHVDSRRWLWSILGQSKQTHCKSRFPWARKSLPLQEPIVRISCSETQTVPSKMLLSYQMSFLLREVLTVLHVVLKGSSLEYKHKFYFVL